MQNVGITDNNIVHIRRQRNKQNVLRTLFQSSNATVDPSVMDPKTAALAEIVRLLQEANRVAESVRTPRVSPVAPSAVRVARMSIEQIRAVPELWISYNRGWRDHETAINRILGAVVPHRGDVGRNRDTVETAHAPRRDLQNRPGTYKRPVTNTSSSSRSSSCTSQARWQDPTTIREATDHAMVRMTPPQPHPPITPMEQRHTRRRTPSSNLMPPPVTPHPSVAQWTGFRPIPVRFTGKAYPNDEHQTGPFDSRSETHKPYTSATIKTSTSAAAKLRPARAASQQSKSNKPELSVGGSSRPKVSGQSTTLPESGGRPLRPEVGEPREVSQTGRPRNGAASDFSEGLEQAVGGDTSSTEDVVMEDLTFYTAPPSSRLASQDDEDMSVSTPTKYGGAFWELDSRVDDDSVG